MSNPPPSASLLLLPGALSFVGAGTMLRTLLGSCVAVAVWHPRLRVGGMCHYLLPGRAGAASAGPDGRFAADALAMLEQQMRATGDDPSQFVAQVAGGAHCLSQTSAGTIDIGQRNAAAALAWCDALGVELLSVDVGGRSSRHVEFDVASGTVRVRSGAPIPAEGLGTMPHEVRA